MDKTYIEIAIQIKDATEADLFVGLLAGINFDGFREEEKTLYACIDKDSFDHGLMAATLPDGTDGLTIREIREENWNAIWESSFEPVIIPGLLSVRAAFHQPVQGVKHEIIITPKMSFGTGHHATTSLMLQEMYHVRFDHCEVLDFGTGTGVLAILAAQLGASSVMAIDNDPWSIENARENAHVNQCEQIQLSLADQLPENNQFDVVLANINRNVILDNAATLSKILRPGGRLMLSGLLVADREDIESAFSARFSHPPLYREKNGWIVLIY
jgi:ribosomal protein L11 methyltransferase